jgi:hypothetical protein
VRAAAVSGTFKAELEFSRKRLIAETPNGAELEYVLKIINTWKKRPEVEDVWKTIRKEIPDSPPPQMFIGFVS